MLCMTGHFAAPDGWGASGPAVDRGHGSVTEDHAAFGIDGYDTAAITGLSMHLDHRAAAGAKDGDRSRTESVMAGGCSTA
jgi:hypothetical protein